MGRKLLAIVFLGMAVNSYGIDDFELPWVNSPSGSSTMFRSADQLGPVFVVEAYFQTCVYCNENAPSVNALADKYKGNQRVHILDVGVDRNESSYQAWISEHQPNHPVLNDGSRKLVKQLGTTGYPSTYVIDCRGKLLYSHSGLWDSSTRVEIQNAVDAALEAPCLLGKKAY